MNDTTLTMFLPGKGREVLQTKGDRGDEGPEYIGSTGK